MPKKNLNTKLGFKPVGIGIDGQVYEMFCPACSHKMNDLIFKEREIEYPEKQCPICLTIYQLACSSREGASSAKEIILAPRTREWLKKNGEKHLRGAMKGSW